MEKQFYITEEEQEKCRRVIDAFVELYEIEDEDILLVDAGRYGFVKLQGSVKKFVSMGKNTSFLVRISI